MTPQPFDDRMPYGFLEPDACDLGDAPAYYLSRLVRLPDEFDLASVFAAFAYTDNDHLA